MELKFEKNNYYDLNSNNPNNSLLPGKAKFKKGKFKKELKKLYIYFEDNLIFDKIIINLII